MSRYRIALADDHVLLRQGLRRIVAEAPELEVVGEAGDGLELLQLLNRIVTDMVVLDISMPNLRGLEAIRELKSRHPGVKVLILTMHRDREYLRQAIDSSADGYLLKEDADTELFCAIQKIRDNGFYVSPSLAKESAEINKRTCRAESGRELDREGLTTREREVVKLIAEGKSSRQVAELLCISVRTVDHHRANIMDKLQLRNTADLVKYAINKGYIEIVSHRQV
jgi:DNA-binding NarL/FixJ family response regulator